MIDLALLGEALPLLLHSAVTTLLIALVASAMGLLLGVGLAIAQTHPSRFIRGLVALYVGFFRGTPMLVQILFAYYVLPEFGLMIPSLAVAIMAIGCNSGAYVSQIVRSGIDAVSKGQCEAASTLGMTPWQIRRYLVLPQAFRLMLPPLCSEFVTLVKDSSLASVIGVVELSKQASILRSTTYDAFTIMLCVSCIYLLLITSLTGLFSLIEKRMRHA